MYNTHNYAHSCRHAKTAGVKTTCLLWQIQLVQLVQCVNELEKYCSCNWVITDMYIYLNRVPFSPSFYKLDRLRLKRKKLPPFNWLGKLNFYLQTYFVHTNHKTFVLCVPKYHGAVPTTIYHHPHMLTHCMFIHCSRHCVHNYML